MRVPPGFIAAELLIADEFNTPVSKGIIHHSDIL